MKEIDRRAALACLQAVEVNMAELSGIDAWRERIGPVGRDNWRGWMSIVRAYQHDLKQPGLTLDQAIDADAGNEAPLSSLTVDQIDYHGAG